VRLLPSVNAFSRQGFRHVLSASTCCRGFSTAEVVQSHPPPMQAHEPSGLTWWSTSRIPLGFALRFALLAVRSMLSLKKSLYILRRTLFMIEGHDEGLCTVGFLHLQGLRQPSRRVNQTRRRSAVYPRPCHLPSTLAIILVRSLDLAY
jgi:hypothetical protein